MKISHAILLGCVLGFSGRGYLPISSSVGNPDLKQVNGSTTKQSLEFRVDISGQTWNCKFHGEKASVLVSR